MRLSARLMLAAGRRARALRRSHAALVMKALPWQRPVDIAFTDRALARALKCLSYMEDRLARSK